MKIYFRVLSIMVTMVILLGCSMFSPTKATPAPAKESKPQEPKQMDTRPPLGIGSQKTSDKDDMIMVYVPEGNFQMGTTDGQSSTALQMCLKGGNTQADCEDFLINREKPAHTVWLEAYWIDRTDVTNAQFQRFVTASNYKSDAEKAGKSYGYNASSKKWEQMDGAYWKHPQGPQSSLSGLENHPVVHVSWNDALAYCQWAGRSLPTEAQWEKAARGTDGRIFPWGNQNPAGNLLNFADKNLGFSWSDKNVDDGYQLTSPVGYYPDGASPYGALDMAGNVWQWTADWGDNSYYASSPDRNPMGPSSGKSRIVRGGSWFQKDDLSRSAVRNSYTPSSTSDDFGFRCATSAAP